MHAISFKVKRAHLCAVAFEKRFLRGLRGMQGMTPARFHVLYAIRRSAIVGGSTRSDGTTIPDSQSALARRLGLHRSTVGEMLVALEALRWIHRERSSRDRRTRLIYFTRRGLRLMRKLMNVLFRQRLLRQEYERIFGDRIEAVYGIRQTRLPRAAKATPPQRSNATPRLPARRPPYLPRPLPALLEQHAISTEAPAPEPEAPPRVVPHVVRAYHALDRTARLLGDRSRVWFDYGERQYPSDLDPYIVAMLGMPRAERRVHAIIAARRNASVSYATAAP